jgi:exodeoxyribonuclease VII large subunit
MIDVLTRRFPRVSIILAPTLVQGEGASAKIAAAIELQNELAAAEVLIVGRGGGSIEDLWAFNEEPAVRAVVASRIPVISAVGHEIDYTLCDYAADMRAPTPSAAAELAVRREADVLEELAGSAFRLRTALSRLAESARARLAEISARPAFSRPQEELVGSRRQRLDEMALRLGSAARQGLAGARERTAGLGGRLEGLSPLAALQRGYSVTLDEDGKTLRDARDAKKGDAIRTVLARGEILSRVEESRNGQEEE